MLLGRRLMMLPLRVEHLEPGARDQQAARDLQRGQGNGEKRQDKRPRQQRNQQNDERVETGLERLVPALLIRPTSVIERKIGGFENGLTTGRMARNASRMSLNQSLLCMFVLEMNHEKAAPGFWLAARL